MQPPPAHIWILDTPTEDLHLMFLWHNVILNVSADIAGWTSSTLVSMVCTAGTSKRRPMRMLCEQDARVLEIFRLVLLTHVHLARLSGQKRAARAKWAPPAWVLRNISYGVSEGKAANFFFSFGLSFVFFFLCYCSMKTNPLKPSCLLGRAIWSRFSLILTVQMGFQRNHISHPTVKFQGHDQWTAFFSR